MIAFTPILSHLGNVGEVPRQPRMGHILVSALGPGFTAAFVMLLPQAVVPSDALDEGDRMLALSLFSLAHSGAKSTYHSNGKETP